MSETRDYRTAKTKLSIDGLYVSDWQKETQRTERQARIMQCTVLVIAWLVLMVIGPGEL